MSSRMTATRLSGGAVWLTPLGGLSIDGRLPEGSGLSIRGGTRSATLRAGSRDRHLGYSDRLAALGEIAG
jgi:hypothetical protein